MRHLVLVSDAEATCGVEEFARQMAQRADAVARPLGSALGTADDVVLNLPVLAWKKRLIAPIVTAARARLAGRQVTVVLHEWADLKLARRLSYLPLLPLATRLLFSSPEVRAQFEATPVSRVVTRARGIMPIPPNFSVPEWTQGSGLTDRLAAARAAGRLVVAQFGSIYLRKDPLAFLAAIAELGRRGVDVEALMIGGFVRDSGDVEGVFTAEVARLGLAGRVTVTGYVRGAPELYGLFAQVDAFLYPLSEGLTSRRASVLAAALSGRPVVVSAPARADALAHHALFRTLVERGAIQLVPRGAGVGALADAILATRGVPAKPFNVTREVEAVWADAIAALEGTA